MGVHTIERETGRYLMETKHTDTPLVIDNVVNLDIRHATEEAVAGIERISNVVNLIYSPETAGLIGRLGIGNVVNRIEVPAGATIQHSDLVLDHEALSQLAEPLSAVVFGRVQIESDVTSDDVVRGIDHLSVFGQLLVPEDLVDAIEGKVHLARGPMQTYPRDVRLVARGLTLDEHFLRSCADGTKLMITGRLDASRVLPNDLLARKIAQIHVADGVTCREENSGTLLPRLVHRGGPPHVTVIPAGFELVERPLTLSAALLKALPARKLYCTERVRIGEDVDTDVLDRALDALIAKDLVLCPAALSPVLGQKLDMLETDVLFYEGQLWLTEEGGLMSLESLEHAEEKLAVIVLGALTIDSGVTPKLLADRVAVVHNRGMIAGTVDQVAILQLRQGSGQGDWVERKPSKEDEGKASEAPKPAANRISNIINLEL
jgi:hypothetical protein